MKAMAGAFEDSSAKEPMSKMPSSSKSGCRRWYKKARMPGLVPSSSTSGATTGQTPGACYNCGKQGHYARDYRSGCPMSEKKPGGATSEEKGKAVEPTASLRKPRKWRSRLCSWKQARMTGLEGMVPSLPSVTDIPVHVEPVRGTPALSVPTQFQQSELGQTLTAILDAFRSQSQQAPVQQQGLGSSWLSTFRALSPPAYIGTESAVRTEEWLDTIQELLAGIRCPNNMAVTLVVTHLELHAKRWWKSLIGSTFHGRVYTDISWNEFSEAFLEHFIPSAARDGLEERFLQLKQGSMSVTEYQQEFQHLARFADSYELDDRGYAKRFYKGLRDPLRQALLFIADSSLAEIIDMAKRLEADHLGSGKRPAEGVMEAGPSNRRIFDNRRGRGYRRGGGHFPQNFREERPVPQPPALPPPQQFQQHGGRQEQVCFECNQPGHIRRYYPQLFGDAPFSFTPAAPRGRGYVRGRGRGPRGRNPRPARDQMYALDMTQERNP
ncbi:hypothetical protein KSP39_PZI016199 [Platanthera zijinensis]|uniref:CCHC-type domain-containing protein n=1 Tax=Platanthera zijinensis TaxID=2320716 RepID=A0AAP0B8H3_9ASPA